MLEFEPRSVGFSWIRAEVNTEPNFALSSVRCPNPNMNSWTQHSVRRSRSVRSLWTELQHL